MLSINETLNFTKKNFLPYCVAMDKNYSIGNHTIKIAKALQGISEGWIKNLIIEAPPRHGKTYSTCELFPPFFFGNNPEKEVMYATSNQRLANKTGRRVRNFIKSKSYNRLFPQLSLATDSKSKSEFDLNTGGHYYALGVQGQSNGIGAHLYILDDLLKGYRKAMSAKERQNIIDFYEADVVSRMYENSSQIIMSTRWHDNDLIGHVLKEHKTSNFKVLKFPALNEDETESLWPERFSLEFMKGQKSKMSAIKWAALYMQSPIPDGGHFINYDDLKFYDYLPKKIDRWYTSWDTGLGETGGNSSNSYCVGTLWAKSGPDIYLIDLIREQMGFIKICASIEKWINEYPQAVHLVEKKAAGTSAIDVLKNKYSRIIPIIPNGSKEFRFDLCSANFKCGNVHLPKESSKPKIKEYITELLLFNSGEHDDQVDSTSQAIIYAYNLDKKSTSTLDMIQL